MAYLDFFHNTQNNNFIEVLTFDCSKCTLSFFSFEKDKSNICPYCLNKLIESKNNTIVITPDYVLPLKIDKDNAYNLIIKWINKDWFIDKRLKKYIRDKNNLNCVYIPFWLYDIKTSTDYKGQKGFKKKNNKILWTPIKENITNDFNDILLLASKSFELNHINEFEPWNIIDIKNFDIKMIDKEKVELYNIKAQDKFQEVEKIIDYEIRIKIEDKIDSIYQKINNINSNFDNIIFKHLLIPIWIITYLDKDKNYRFIVNSQNGEIIGEKIYNKSKFIIIIFFMIIFTLLIYLIN